MKNQGRRAIPYLEECAFGRVAFAAGENVAAEMNLELDVKLLLKDKKMLVTVLLCGTEKT